MNFGVNNTTCIYEIYYKYIINVTGIVGLQMFHISGLIDWPALFNSSLFLNSTTEWFISYSVGIMLSCKEYSMIIALITCSER